MVITIVWSAVSMAFIAYKIADMVVGPRVPEEGTRGSDITSTAKRLAMAKLPKQARKSNGGVVWSSLFARREVPPCRTWRRLNNGPMPKSSTPALFPTIVSSRVPACSRPSIDFPVCCTEAEASGGDSRAVEEQPSSAASLVWRTLSSCHSILIFRFLGWVHNEIGARRVRAPSATTLLSQPAPEQAGSPFPCRRLRCQLEVMDLDTTALERLDVDIVPQVRRYFRTIDLPHWVSGASRRDTQVIASSVSRT